MSARSMASSMSSWRMSSGQEEELNMAVKEAFKCAGS